MGRSVCSGAGVGRAAALWMLAGCGPVVGRWWCAWVVAGGGGKSGAWWAAVAAGRPRRRWLAGCWPVHAMAAALPRYPIRVAVGSDLAHRARVQLY